MSDAADPEPRAGAVVRAATARQLGFDPAARWEREAARSPEPRRVLLRHAPPVVDVGRLLRVSLERTDVAPPPEVLASLAHKTPQWFLRDLDRPRALAEAPLEPVPGLHVLGGWGGAPHGLAALRGAPIRAPRHVAATEIIAADVERRRVLRGEPWAAVLRDDEPRRHAAEGAGLDRW